MSSAIGATAPVFTTVPACTTAPVYTTAPICTAATACNTATVCFTVPACSTALVYTAPACTATAVDNTARVLSMMNTTDSVRADDDAGTEVDLPFLEKFHDARWFDKIDIAAGSMPISFEPGIRFNSKMYHKGAYDGGHCRGRLQRDGIQPPARHHPPADDVRLGDGPGDTRFEGELLDTDIWPPMWMIFTRRFELGLMATPTLLMRGDFAGVDK
ncbi:unnamed protein product, partial [Prorocentrum cordatum]